MSTRLVAPRRAVLPVRLCLLVLAAIAALSAFGEARAACVPVLQRYHCAGGLCVGCPDSAAEVMRACGEAVYAANLQGFFGALTFLYELNDVGGGIQIVYSSVRNGNYGSILQPTGSTTDCPEVVRNLGPKQCPAAGGPVFANPVNVGIGNKLQVESDYAASGPFALSFRRYYNSAAPLDSSGTVGARWTHEFARRLDALTQNATKVRALRADGEVIFFNTCPTGYCGGLDEKAKLTRSTNAQGYTTGWQFVDENDVVETYDGGGRLLTEKSRGGVVHTLTYDPVKFRLSAVKDSFGHQIGFAYDTSGRINLVTEPGGATIAFTYDAAGNLSTVTYPGAASRTYLYNESGYVAAGATTNLLTGILDESGARFASYRYDSSSRAIDSQHAGAAEHIQVTYNANGSRTVVDPVGTSRTYGIQITENVTHLAAVTGPRCASCNLWATYGYNTGGDLTSTTDFVGSQSVSSFNVRHLEESHTDASGTPAARTTTTTWHATYRIPTGTALYAGSAATGTPIFTETFTHDSAGNVLTRTVTDTSVTPNVARTWTSTYDSFGRVLTVDGPRTDVSDLTTYTYYTCTTGSECGQVHTIVNALGQTTNFSSYNADGQPLTITDANSVTTTLTYDGRQHLASRQIAGETTQFLYFPTGLLQRVTLPDSSFIAYTYDDAQRLIKVEDSSGNRIEYTLDGSGNRTAETAYDPSNTLARTRTQVFDGLSQLWKQIGAAGTAAVTTTFGYDANGNATSINAPLSRNTSRQYDELNRLKQITDANSGIAQFSYDAQDNLASVTDALNHVTSYTYDGFGALTQVASPDAGTAQRTYDSAGNLATETDARSKTATYGYDALNRVAAVTYPDLATTLTYDAGANGAGRLTGAADANHSLSFTYDAQGRVVGKTQTVGAVSKSVSYGYANGNLTSLVTPSGQTVTYGYSQGRVASVTLNGSTPILSQALYEPFGPVAGWQWGNGTYAVRVYDTDGKPTTVDSAGTSSYGYDDAFRITSITDLGDNTKSWTYGYDALDRVSSAVGSQTIGYTYDANGNRLTQTGTQAATYSISPTNSRISSITGAPARTYGYDSAGNVTSDGTNTYTYTDAGRLSTVTRSGVTTTYTYNAVGERVKKSSTAGSEYFVYDEAGHLIGEYDGSGALIQETVWLNDTPVATLRPNGAGVSVYYVHTDHLDTPRRISRPGDNTIVWRWDGDPFGAVGPNEDPDGDLVGFSYGLRFAGQYFDAESGNAYNSLRDFDPATGRYLEPDPAGLDGGLNPYLYVDADPLQFIDPYGLWKVKGPNVPDPNTVNPLLYVFLNCVQRCYGSAWQIVVTATTNDHTTGAHVRGRAVDLRLPEGAVGANAAVCCSLSCGARYVQDEYTYPSPHATAGHIHAQLDRGRNGASGTGSRPKPKCPSCNSSSYKDAL